MTDAPEAPEVIKDNLTETEADQGMNTLIRTMPSFDVTVYQEDGSELIRSYKMRPLGLNDAVKALRVISAASMGISRLAKDGGLGDAQSVAFTILASVPYAERDFKDLISNILKYKNHKDEWTTVTVSLFEDPDYFPLESLIDVVDALGNHPDLAAFLKNVRKLSKSNLMVTIQESMKDSQPKTTKKN